MLLKVATDEPKTWSAWSRKYKHEGNGIPIVYVVRADGQQLYGKSGTPAPLPLFLVSALKQGGALLPEKKLELLQRNLERAQQLREQGQTEAAVIQLRRNLNTGSFASPAVQSEQIAAELTTEATESLKQAREDLQAEGKRLAAAISMLQIDRDYGGLPQVHKLMGPELKRLRTQTETRDVSKQAESLVKADSYQRDKKWRLALAAYQRVIDRFPKTQAATLASQGIVKVRAESNAPLTTSKTSNPPRPSTPLNAQAKRAASLLRLGKLLNKRNPQHARSYFERAIKTAPDSDAAAEARQLLRKPR